MSEPEREACLLPVQSLVAAYTVVTLDADNAGRFLSGLRRRGTPGQWGLDAALVQVYGPSVPLAGLSTGDSGQAADAGAFLGSAHITADELIPGRLLSPIEIQDMQAQKLLGSDTNFAAAQCTASSGQVIGLANLGSDPKNSQ